MIKNISIILLLFPFTLILSQKLPTIKVDEIKPKGKNKIYYYLKDGYKYIPNTKIIDWYASLEKINTNEEYNPKKMYFVEHCKYEGGLKNGEFDISLITLSRKETTTIAGTIYWLSEGQQVLFGNYENNYLSGKVSVLTYVDFKEITGYLTIDYVAGKISNQTVNYPSAITYERSPYYDLKLSLVPQVTFENGQVKEISHIESTELPSKKVYFNEGVFVTRYTFSPSCFNNYRFEVPSRVKEILNYNTNKFSIESFLDKSPNQTGKIEGEYRLFLPRANDMVLDTSYLVATFVYRNGLRDGLAQIWDESKNGKNGDSPYIEHRYTNDLLHGESKLFFPDHKVSLLANFNNGYVVGEVKSFSNGSAYLVFALDGIIRRTVDEGGVLSINQVNEKHGWSNELYESIELIKNKKGVINENDEYCLYSKANYVIDSTKISSGKYVKFSKVKDYVSVYNGKFEILKKFYEKEDPSKLKELSYIDETGKTVYSLSQAVSEVNAAKKILQNEADKVNNQIVRCHYCNIEAKLGTTISNGDCDCIKLDKLGNKQKTSLYIREVWPFCSRKCLVDWEKSICIKNGYTRE